MSAHARGGEAVKLCVRHGVKVICHANFAVMKNGQMHKLTPEKVRKSL